MTTSEKTVYLTSEQVIDAFNAAVQSRIRSDREPTYEQRQNAILAVARSKPALYRAYVLATNPGKRAQRIIEEKFDDAAAR